MYAILSFVNNFNYFQFNKKGEITNSQSNFATKNITQRPDNFTKFNDELMNS